MEVIAAVSSVAGLLSLLGECIGATRKLLDFCSDISSASLTVTNFIFDINLLLENLHSVNELVKKLPEDLQDFSIAPLQKQLIKYSKDACLWVSTARALRPASDIGAKAWFQKFWIAASIKPIGDMRDQLDRHNQTISLNLALLGRALDVSTTKTLRNIDTKIDYGTVASLSKIQEQSAMLVNIEAYSEAGMHSSAASVRSLRSIASSLSKIETLASSAASASMSHKADGGAARPRSWSRRRNTGDFQIRSQRRSNGSTISKRFSNTSARSSPAAPRVSQTLSFFAQDDHISEDSDESSTDKINNGEFEPQWSGSLNVECLKETPHIDRSLHKQYQFLHDLTQRSAAKIYPANILEYVSIIQMIRDYENKINVLSLLGLRANMGDVAAIQSENSVNDADLQVLQHERDALQLRLHSLQEQQQRARRRCILAGDSLYDIDQRFGLLNPSFRDHSHTSMDTDMGIHPSPTPVQELHQVLVKKDHLFHSHLLCEWTTKRDRINRWLLHSLNSDDTQAQLHMAMLADPPIDHKAWAEQAVNHWFLDEAAVNAELQLSLSVGAVDSHTADAPERIVEIEGVKASESLRGFDFF